MKYFGKLNERNSIKLMSDKCKQLLMRLLINREKLEITHKLMNSFHKWRTHSISGTFTKGRITNKIKGRLLISLCKDQPSLTKQNSFLRWKIKADISVARKAVEKFALNAKLNAHSALWKLKAGMAKKRDAI